MPEITCELIRTTEDLRALGPEWRALWSADPNATPFQSPEWLLPWWNQFAQPGLRAVTIRRGSELIGLLPLYVFCEPQTGERKLLLVGAGTSDYLDGLFAPACTAAHVQTALDCLQQQGGWDAFHAMQLRSESRLLKALERCEARRFETEFCSRMPAVSMGDLPVKIRRNAMYYRNRAARMGTLELNFADGSNCGEAFDALVRLHAARWQTRGEPGVLADVRVLEWHREALPLLANAGMLRLCSLCLNGEPIGIMYSLVDPPGRKARTQYMYLPAFSPAHADLRPGTVLLGLAIEHAAQEGVQIIDMLRGDEAYKQMWHLERVPTYGLHYSLQNAALAQERAA